jgi:acyl carrier protein
LLKKIKYINFILNKMLKIKISGIQVLQNSLNKISNKFFAAAAEKMPVLDSKQKGKDVQKEKETTVQPWVEVENRLAKLRGELVLTQHAKIEKYVLSVIRGYFRTTYKEALTVESNLSDHGLDSLDSIEIGMILEDELGYIIEAENLPQFKKVKHFVNFIKQMEAYKKEFLTLPQLHAQEPEESWDDWIPEGEKLKSLLFKKTTAPQKKAEDKKTEKVAKH